ncbi:MAG: 5'-deoxynucleotidase [Clostridia bacterium]|nr:5'-deoxynucleotidase [Clostridia bacterium]
MSSSFFAMLSRMKYISRWSLMRNVERESLSEHSMETAVIAHALAVLRNTRFGGNVDADRVALLALYHDISETLTGDMPTPVKYTSPQMRAAYGEVERSASQRLMLMLPEDLRGTYTELICQDEQTEEHRLVKAADRLSALIKCIEERKAGNRDFASAEKSTLDAIVAMDMPETQVFIEEFLPAYSLTLDEL